MYRYILKAMGFPAVPQANFTCRNIFSDARGTEDCYIAELAAGW